jgi:hypothetical protein
MQASLTQKVAVFTRVNWFYKQKEKMPSVLTAPALVNNRDSMDNGGPMR